MWVITDLHGCMSTTLCWGGDSVSLWLLVWTVDRGMEVEVVEEVGVVEVDVEEVGVRCRLLASGLLA